MQDLGCRIAHDKVGADGWVLRGHGEESERGRAVAGNRYEAAIGGRVGLRSVQCPVDARVRSGREEDGGARPRMWGRPGLRLTNLLEPKTATS